MPTDTFAVLAEIMSTWNRADAMEFAAIMAEQLGLDAFKPPVAFPPLEIAQYWHERFHREPGNVWLRGVYMSLLKE